jgi:HK97 family phage major capsid protein
MSRTPLLTPEEIREQLNAEKLEAETTDAALQTATAPGSDADEDTINDLRARFDQQTAHLASLAETLERKEKMDKALAGVPEPPEDKRSYGSGVRSQEPLTYRARGPHSFFKDVLFASKEGDPGAQARLARHMREMQIEGRAMDTTSSSGLGFIAPQYLQDQWARFARAGRPFADAIGAKPLPAVGVSFNVPRLTTGSAVAVQATEGAAVNDTTPVAGDIVLPVETVAGKVDMSRQLFERSDPAMDSVIGQDLAASYNQQVDSEIINGPGSGGRVKGILAATGVNAVTYTQATPTAATLYPKVADAIVRIDVGRYLPADLILMHPRRWGSLLAALDSSNRPLVVPRAPAMNPMGVQENQRAEGVIGYLQGIDVVKDANIPITQGAGTNQDAIVVTVRDALLFFESTGGPTVRVYEEVLSGTLQVRILAFGYIAFTAERYPTATSLITGTGLITPTF